MIPKEKKLILIGLYMYICDVHKSSLRFHCQRFSNNSNPEFTDEEVLTIYLFCGYCQRYFCICISVMSISLLCVSTARDSATIPIPSLRMRRFLPYICSAGTARDTSTSRRYILSPRSICHHGFQNCRLIKRSAYA